MDRTKAVLLAVTVGAAILPTWARTDGCFMPSEQQWRKRRERSLILEPDQKALIYFENRREQLVISPNYAGDATNFAWVVPVPSRPKVEILKGAPFHELARLIEPPPPATARRMEGGAKSASAPSGVAVLERKTVGDYDVSVLSATDEKALRHWLDDNHYHVPPNAEAPIRTYIGEGWTFVACKIRVNDTANGLKSGTLTPLRLTFAAPHPIYPMRMSAASAQPFTVLLYVAEPLSQGRGSLLPISEPTVGRLGVSNPRASVYRTYASQTLPATIRDAYPTLAKLSPSGLQITWLREQFRPEQCDHDFIWTHRPQLRRGRFPRR